MMCVTMIVRTMIVIVVVAVSFAVCVTAARYAMVCRGIRIRVSFFAVTLMARVILSVLIVLTLMIVVVAMNLVRLMSWRACCVVIAVRMCRSVAWLLKRSRLRRIRSLMVLFTCWLMMRSFLRTWV